MQGQLSHRTETILDAKKFITQMLKLSKNVVISIKVGTTYKAHYTSFTVENINEVIGYKVSYWTNPFDPDRDNKWVTVAIKKDFIERITVTADFN